MIFQKWGSKAVWNFSENSSVLETPSFPKGKFKKDYIFGEWVIEQRKFSVFTVGWVGGCLQQTSCFIFSPIFNLLLSNNDNAFTYLSSWHGWANSAAVSVGQTSSFCRPPTVSLLFVYPFYVPNFYVDKTFIKLLCGYNFYVDETVYVDKTFINLLCGWNF